MVRVKISRRDTADTAITTELLLSSWNVLSFSLCLGTTDDVGSRVGPVGIGLQNL